MVMVRRGLERGWRWVGLLCLCVWAMGWARLAPATTIDVLIVYDTTAANWVATNGGMTAFAQDAINRMNQATQNSDVDISFRLVHVMSIPYTTRSSSDSPFTEDLNALQAGQGVFSQVAAARDTYGADLVAMLIDTGLYYGYTGLGSLLGSWSGDPKDAHTVCAIRAVAVGHTLTHEIGHNLGAHHSKYQNSSPGPNKSLDNLYSAGWYFSGTNGTAYHTIMAYAEDGYGHRYIEAPLFSTPLKTYQGTAAGHPQDGDNARLLRETKNIVANYRQSSSTPTIPSPPTALAATNITSTGFTANWTAVSGATGYWFELATNSSFTSKLYDGALGNVTTQAVRDLTPSTTYYYRLKAYNDAGQSSASNVVSVTTSAQGDQSAYARQVYVMYAGYFGRPPAPAGYSYYTGWMDRSNGNYRIIVDDFYRSAESQQIYGILTTPQQITQVFQFLFARDPTSSGLQYWSAMVNSGQISVAEMAYTIAYSAAADDQAVLDAKVAAATAFQEELARVQQTRSCAMDPDYGRVFLAQVSSAEDAAREIKDIKLTVDGMCL
ncbi:DUF4214 domain-containing protein [Caldichromatium japonicum]|uniref:DUF4214 domain-containing protein n=1 Tax=Caldichromatium japonicum TaxID=2699430 RepID=A0A6G7V9Y4_9GAMM|nr:M12 family metallo-peptidase [Caldichromatium japonicum]QIK36794.1 DUF4214 domain-containing protein [Caldichromatium japonicum]